MTPLRPGDPLPWVAAPSRFVPRFRSESAAGLRLVLAVPGPAGDPRVAPFVAALPALHRALDERGVFLAVVSTDPADLGDPALHALDSVIPVLRDHDLAVATALGAAVRTGAQIHIRPSVIVADPGQRVTAVLAPLQPGFSPLDILAVLDAAPPPAAGRPGLHPPVLRIPDVLDQPLCQRLVRLWEEGGNAESGYMLPTADGRLQEYLDPVRKVRRDHVVAPDSAVWAELSALIGRRVAPAMERAFHFPATRIERFCIACYDSADRGHFRKHRDFDGPDSHRSFALTINLNGGFEGGGLQFPEYGDAEYVPAAGEAVVFSGYLMHAAAPVTAGRRFALLSFLYGEREQAVIDRYVAQFGRDFAQVRPA